MPSQPWKTLFSPALKKRPSTSSTEQLSPTTTTTTTTTSPTTSEPQEQPPLNRQLLPGPKKKHPFRLRIDVTNRHPPISPSIMFRRLSSVFSSSPSSANTLEGGPTCLLNHMSHKNAEAYLSTIYTQIYKNELARRSNARTEGSPYNTDVAARNMKKNRYQDVLPYEKYRVRIGKEIGSSVDQESYINASHLISVDPKIRYIATQGPLPATQGAFWQMVYEQKTRVVVMLAQEEENGHIKCHRYWPKRIGERLVLEEQGLEVQLTEERGYSDIECVVRTLSVSRTPVEGHIEGESEENQIVYQIHYSNWPDHGLPTSATALLKVIRFANSIQLQRNEFEALSSCSSATATETATPSTSQPGPMVVHCSAGVGRTGTFCVIDAALSLLGVPGYGIPARPLTDNETTQLVQSPVFASSPPSPTSPDKNEDIIHTLVERFRQQRMFMVQTPAQFGYCYINVKEGYQSARRARSESDPGSRMRFHAPA